MVAVAINLIIDIAFVNKIGIYAASLSTLISYLLLFIFRMVDVRKIVYIRINYKQVVGLLLIIIAESIACYLQNSILDGINLVFRCCMLIVLNRNMIVQLAKSILHRRQKVGIR